MWTDCPLVIGAEPLDFSDLAMEFLKAGNTKDLETLVVAAWAIWHNRNLKVFELDSQWAKQGAKQTWDMAISMIYDFKEADKFCSLSPAAGDVCWRKPPDGVFKINTDGAAADDGRRSSIGVIIRDCRGQVVAALCRVLSGCFSVDETEVLAIEAGILLAKEMDLNQIIIESDSLSSVQRILSKDCSGGFGHIVNGIISFLDGFMSWRIRHLKRDFNRVAHELARFAHCNNASQVWRGVSPPVVRNLLHLDGL